MSEVKRNVVPYKIIIIGLDNMGDILIDETFKDLDKKTLYSLKDYRIYLQQKEYTSQLGSYDLITNTIKISSFKSEPRSQLIITFIHELSHHIEFRLNGSTGHQKSFYNIHIALLKTAINLDIIKIEDITNTLESKAGNKNKLAKMLSGYSRQGNKTLSDFMDTTFLKYIPEDVVINKTVNVKASSWEADSFKSKGYKWNPDLMLWQKTIHKYKELTVEENGLKNNGFEKIQVNKMVLFAKTIYLIVSTTNTNFDFFVKNGFYYNKNQKLWSKSVKVKELNSEINKIRSKNIGLIKYSVKPLNSEPIST